MKVIGLMSGTSADGIDAALVEIEGQGVALTWQFLAHVHIAYTNDLRSQILAASDPATGSVERLCRLNFALGEEFAQAARRVVRQAALSLTQIDLIGSHGQTVWHDVDADGRVTSTLQIGEAALIAERTGVTTIADFRVADVAAGGQGAPLVPIADFILFRDPHKFRAVQNIGGIANVTLLPPNCAPSDVIAFDSGPGNMVIDALVERMTGGHEHFDHDGHIAASGGIDQAWLAELLAHPYFKRTPPKTTGRELFGKQYANSLWEQGVARGLAPQEIIATATALTAESVARAVTPIPRPLHTLRYIPQGKPFDESRTGEGEQLPPLSGYYQTGEGRAGGHVDELILGGGGADNRTLMHMLAERLPHTKILLAEDFGIPTQAKEALAFAILAYAAYHHEPNNLPSVTGARHPVVMGKLSRP